MLLVLHLGFSSFSNLYTFLFPAICFIAFFPGGLGQQDMTQHGSRRRVFHGHDKLFSQKGPLSQTKKTIQALKEMQMEGDLGIEHKRIYFIIRSIIFFSPFEFYHDFST